ncbi:unnamed protein product [Dibothriocephalus latus]|uniref:Uncharacterized protein n=1 Tax=Dibothriocephalus latus TaxID=60516 RepID=A0A3P6V1H8_DIBLA|nr:unnamed protein product [Dibothriocephalus latus]
MSSLDDIDDSRLRFVFEYLRAMSDMKIEKLLKLREDQVSMDKIMEFFESSDLSLLVIIFGFGGGLEVFFEYPPAMKNKALYFVKKEKNSYEKGVDINLLKANVIYGDMHKSPLHHFIAFVNTVLSPIILNERNREGWPETLNEYIKRDLFNLQKKSDFVLARAEGRTYLAHPIGLEKIDSQDPISCHKVNLLWLVNGGLRDL